MSGEPAWQGVLTASRRLRALLPDAVLVGESAAASHAGHRVSFDDDHVLDDLRNRFDDVLEHLERTKGWVTSRPVLILGSLHPAPTPMPCHADDAPDRERPPLLAGGRALGTAVEPLGSA